MKKNLFISAILLSGLLWIVTSCDKETFTEQDAYTAQKDLLTLEDSLKTQQALLLDSLKHTGGVINYSVAPVLASDATWYHQYTGYGYKGELALDQVVVTISQYGKTMSVTTDASGIASFKDLRVGTVNVNIRKTGFTEVDFVALLPALPDSTTVYAYDIVRHVGTMVPVFSTTANLSTISGIATVETDLTNDAPEIAANVEVIGTIDVDDYDFQKYIYHPVDDIGYSDDKKWWIFDYYGVIKQIAFHSTVSRVTTAADGTFSLKVPSTPDGLPILLYTSEFAATQKLLQPTVNNIPVWGVQSVRTIFGGSSVSSVPSLGTLATQVQSAYVTIGAPTGTPAAQPTTPALATAVLANNGIISINISNPGDGYTQAPNVIISKGTVPNSVQAEGTAVLTNGRVTSVTITSAGSGYKPGDTPTLTFAEGIITAASATPRMGYGISGIGVTNQGAGYTAAPAVTINSNTGTGATATANMTGYVSALTLTNPGAGYTATPIVTIAPSSGVQATATVTMTVSNPVHSVTVPVNSTLWLRRKWGTRIASAGNVGSGAVTDSTSLSSAGRIYQIPLTNVGAGYLVAPSVTITGGGGFGATAYATLAAGTVSGIVITNPGTGYTSDPTVTIGAPPTGGTQATAIARREFQVTGISVTANGNGYVATGGNAAFVQILDPGSATVLNGGTYSIFPVLSQSIASINVNAGGDEYTAAPAVTITPANGVVTTAATATSAILYRVRSISVTASGSGYEGTDIAVAIGAPPVGGTQAVAGTITRLPGQLKRIISGAPGAGYTAAPNVYVVVTAPGVVPTVQAEVTAAVSGGSIAGYTISDPGAGYSYASEASGYYSLAITTFHSSAAATAKPNPKSGQIEFIQVDNPGAGYVVVPVVEIVNPANAADANKFGTGGTATAVVTDGRVSAITVTNAGSGYYVAPTIRITVASTVMNAVAMCTVSSDGRITGVTFPAFYPYTKGYGYNAVPTVTFTPSIPGKGTGAAGVAVLNNGAVDAIIMTNQGSGYTGKNNPSSGQYMMLKPDNSMSLTVYAGKTYIRDISFGTGLRTVEQ